MFKKADSVNDPGSGWILIQQAIDYILSNYSDSNDVSDQNWTQYLYMLMNRPRFCSMVRVYGAGMSGNCEIDVYNVVTSSWENIYTSVLPLFQWVFVEFSRRLISQARIRFFNNTGGEDHAAVTELHFYIPDISRLGIAA